MSEVIVYSTPACPYCKMVKNFLEEKGVTFTEKDVSVDRDAAKYMIKKSGQMGVPQVELDGKFIVGFDRTALEEALEELEQ